MQNHHEMQTIFDNNPIDYNGKMSNQSKVLTQVPQRPQASFNKSKTKCLYMGWRSLIFNKCIYKCVLERV